MLHRTSAEAYSGLGFVARLANEAKTPGSQFAAHAQRVGASPHRGSHAVRSDGAPWPGNPGEKPGSRWIS